MPLTNPVEVVVLSRSVELTDAQVKALPTTAIELVPAPGPNKMILPFYGVVRLSWVADYTNIDAGAQLMFKVGAGGDVLFPFRQDVQGNVAGVLAGGGPDGSIGWTCARFVGVVSAAPGGVTPSGISQFYDSDLVNLPMRFMADNQGAGDFTGGNAGNALTVTALYTIIDV